MSIIVDTSTGCRISWLESAIGLTSLSSRAVVDSRLRSQNPPGYDDKKFNFLSIAT